MAYTEEELFVKLRKADAAGDTEAAKALANEIRKVRETSEKPLSWQETAKGGAVNAVDSALLGWGDEAIAGLNTAGEWLGSTLAGGDINFADRYARNKASLKRLQDRYSEENPAWATVGDIGGALLTAGVTPGARTIAGTAGIAGGEGALQYLGEQDTEDYSIGGLLQNTLLSASLGGGMDAAGKFVGHLLDPRLLEASRAADIMDLERRGIKPTIGQTLGGWADRLEQAATSLPIAGQKISNARLAAQKQFNRAAVNEALRPVGGKVDDIGHAGFRQAEDLISSAYDDALGVANGFNLDAQDVQDLTNVWQNAKYMTPSEDTAFKNFWKDKIVSRFSDANGITSESFKQLESELGKKIGATSGELQGAYKEVLSILRDSVAKASPETAVKLKQANEAFKRLEGVKRSVNAASGTEGVFTPKQLVAGVKGADLSKRKRMSARGEGAMNVLGDRGSRILSDTLPNSGTTDRAIVSAALGGGGAGLAMVEPLSAALGISSIGLLRQAYTETGQKLLISALTRRGMGFKEAAELVEQAANLAARAAANPEAWGENQWQD